MAIAVCGVLAVAVSSLWYKCTIEPTESEMNTFRFHMFQSRSDALARVFVNFVLVAPMLLWRGELVLRSLLRKALFVTYAAVVCFWTSVIIDGLRGINEEE